MTGSTNYESTGNHNTPSACKSYSCSKCCHETEMTLSEEDIRLILEKGHLEFTRLVDGYQCLENVNGACVFLENGLCSIYEYRPLGCRFYPVIFDEERNCAIMDEFCPYLEMFRIEQDSRKLSPRPSQTRTGKDRDEYQPVFSLPETEFFSIFPAEVMVIMFVPAPKGRRLPAMISFSFFSM